MSTCKNCLYWAGAKFKVDASNMAECEFLNTVTAKKHCKDGSGTGVMLFATALGLEVRLITGENFGCVHHKPIREPFSKPSS